MTTGELVEVGGACAVVGMLWLGLVRDGIRRQLFERRIARRSTEAEAVAAEAALEAEAFDPAAIRQAVDAILEAIGEIWDGRAAQT